jgi:hypothetical protein
MLCICIAVVVDLLLRGDNEPAIFPKMGKLPPLFRYGPHLWQMGNVRIERDFEGRVHARRLNTLEELGTWDNLSEAIEAMHTNHIFDES